MNKTEITAEDFGIIEPEEKKNLNGDIFNLYKSFADYSLLNYYVTTTTTSSSTISYDNSWIWYTR